MKRLSVRLLVAVCLLLAPAFRLSAQAAGRSHTFQVTTNNTSIVGTAAASIDAPQSAGQKPNLTIADSSGHWSLYIGIGETVQSGLSESKNGHGPCVSVRADNNRHEFFVLPHSALEWQIILHSPPSSNRLAFPFDGKNIVCYYQDTLTEYERAVMKAERPDSVVGSYAVYLVHDAGKSRRPISKILHIYRPKAFSAKDTVWCDLTITDDSMSIVLPAEFLDKADYVAGVVIDPTFGFDGIPASEANMSYSSLAYVSASLTAGSGCVVTELSTHTKVYSGTSTHDMGVYAKPTGSIVGGPLIGGAHQLSVSNTGARQWNSVTGLSIALDNGTEYCVAAANPNGTVRIGYDLGTIGEYNSSSCVSPTLPAVWNESGRNRYIYALRATYTIQPASSASRRRRTALTVSTH